MDDDDFIALLSPSDEEQGEPARQKRPVPKHEPANTKRPKHQPPHASRQENPWLRPVHLYSRKPIERLQQEIRDLVHYLSPTAKESAARKAVLDRINALVLRLLPGAGVEPFGSYSMGLCLPHSDIDLVIVLQEGEHPDCLGVLRRVARGVARAGIAAPSTLKVISKARVPIVKYTDAASGFPVDVSVNVGSGLEGAKMMGRLMKEHLALRPLTIVLKHYLSLRGLNEVFSGGLGSFSLMCMLVSFLELHPLLQLRLISEKDNLGVLLLDFLELYTRHFNYDVVGVRLKTGYFNRLERPDWEHVKKQGPLMLSVEDPQSPDNDLSRGSFQMGAVKQSLEHAFLVLTSRTLQCEYRQTSLLSALVWIPDRIIRHRHFIQQATELHK